MVDAFDLPPNEGLALLEVDVLPGHPQHANTNVGDASRSGVGRCRVAVVASVAAVVVSVAALCSDMRVCSSLRRLTASGKVVAGHHYRAGMTARHQAGRTMEGTLMATEEQLDALDTATVALAEAAAASAERSSLNTLRYAEAARAIAEARAWVVHPAQPHGGSSTSAGASS